MSIVDDDDDDDDADVDVEVSRSDAWGVARRDALDVSRSETLSMVSLWVGPWMSGGCPVDVRMLLLNASHAWETTSWPHRTLGCAKPQVGWHLSHFVRLRHVIPSYLILMMLWYVMVVGCCRWYNVVYSSILLGCSLYSISAWLHRVSKSALLLGIRPWNSCRQSVCLQALDHATSGQGWPCHSNKLHHADYETIWTVPKHIRRMTLCHQESLSRSQSPSPPRMFLLSLDSAQCPELLSGTCKCRQPGNRETEVKVALLTCVHLLNKKRETLWIQVPNGSVPKAATGIWALANSWPVGLPKLTLAFPVDSKEKDILRQEPCQSLSITEIRWLNYIMQQADQPNRHIGFVSPDLNQQNHIIFHGLRQSPTPGVASAAHEALAPDRNTTNTLKYIKYMVPWIKDIKCATETYSHTHTYPTTGPTTLLLELLLELCTFTYMCNEWPARACRVRRSICSCCSSHSSNVYFPSNYD